MQPLVREFLFDKVAASIVDWVCCHNLQPGDRIPTEMELGRDLQVSRTSIREAIRGLVATGFLEQQQGIGTRIARPTMLTLLAHGPLPYLLTTADEIREFIEARRVLEPEMTALAALKATAEDLTTIESTIEAMERTVEDGVFDDQPWVDFHSALYSAAHNRALEEMATPIVLLLSQLTPRIITGQASKADRAECRHKIAVHRQLYEAVRSGDPQVARQAAIEHIESALAVMLEALDDTTLDNAGIANAQYSK